MSTIQPVNRRVFAGGALALSIFPAAALALSAPSRPLDAGQLPSLRFRAIVVDTGPMAAKGVRAFAELMRQSLGPALARTFADRLAPGDSRAPVLRVVIDSAEFASDVGSDIGSFDANDYLEGAGLIVSGKNLIASYPVLSALGVTNPYRSYSEESHLLRAQLLAEHFAYWLRRGIGI